MGMYFIVFKKKGSEQESDKCAIGVGFRMFASPSRVRAVSRLRPVSGGLPDASADLNLPGKYSVSAAR